MAEGWWRRSNKDRGKGGKSGNKYKSKSGGAIKNMSESKNEIKKECISISHSFILIHSIVIFINVTNVTDWD